MRAFHLYILPEFTRIWVPIPGPTSCERPTYELAVSDLSGCLKP